ncbi:MAG TPA: hypothetical protein VFR42_00340, partial [Candidatus Acidoferrum sp.]|nr:hypothetical protein [Candidatus Acidoferrum sp.]
MSWTERARADIGSSGVNGATIYVADAPAAVAATYSASSEVSCVVEDMNGILAHKGITGAMLQQTAGASLGTNLTTFTQTFPGSVTLGDAIIVALTCAPNAFGSTPITITDSLGNTYTEIYNHILTGGSIQLGIWIAISAASGANTVTATSPGGGGPFSSEFAAPAMAILEYPGHATVDTLVVATSATGGTLPVSITTGGNGETLLNIVGLGPTCAPPSPVLTGPSGGINIPEAWLIVYEYGGSPATGSYVDRSKFLFLGQGGQHTFNL